MEARRIEGRVEGNCVGRRRVLQILPCAERVLRISIGSLLCSFEILAGTLSWSRGVMEMQVLVKEQAFNGQY